MRPFSSVVDPSDSFDRAMYRAEKMRLMPLRRGIGLARVGEIPPLYNSGVSTDKFAYGPGRQRGKNFSLANLCDKKSMSTSTMAKVLLPTYLRFGSKPYG